MDSSQQYKQLIKPQWAPPSWLFGPVWIVLYIIVFISFGYVIYLYFNGTIPFLILVPFIMNLVFNFSFTPIQFRLRNNWLAAIDIVLVTVTLLWALYKIYAYAGWVTYINIPYILWVIFATVLQLTIAFINRKS
ncbi:MAG: tryptophan-rich sensory protein [Actinomycetia bacterium]|nr:tryptophan-rich sensory protein [Actinomycetes bacterium]